MIRKLLTAGLLGSATLLAGCISVLPEVTPATIYRLSTPEPSGEVREEAVIVGVQRPLTPRALSTDMIAMSQSRGQLVFIDGAEWITPVPRLVQDLIVESMDAFEPTLIAARPEDGVRAEFELATELRSFEANYLNGPDAAPTVIVRLRARLIRSSDRRLVAVDAIGAQSAARSNRIGDIVGAFDAASQEAMASVAQWTAEQVAAHHDPEHDH
ncbi:ABC-type transport auxiliary lipoprotein family protein [Hyphobacterium sp. HN65]|uniref:ABC-type transport auxiliary lipoprotein family protein n=1 Tax=Hyphobacterium lacteum TaxID=3116575 RepID=A0ABU7LQQ7_9PROT|nr:ABC-type transport auxiliary lipoprotein family protein [Hyphobacterium sp. HN65]MEE2526253.1 ABC-type transport auxiliary lipoprotein family protein [Hyphobacterium sp. HN65]